ERRHQAAVRLLIPQLNTVHLVLLEMSCQSLERVLRWVGDNLENIRAFLVSFRNEPDDLVVASDRKYDRVNAVQTYFYTRNQNEAAPQVDFAHFSDVIGERRGVKVLEVLGHDAKGQSLIAQDRCD